MKNNADYNEGISDSLAMVERTHMPVKDIIESLDKFLDKINNLKSLLHKIYNHHVNGLDINNIEFDNVTQKNKNLKDILDLIKLEIEKDKIGDFYGKTQETSK